jgi:hypothetical protein
MIHKETIASVHSKVHRCTLADGPSESIFDASKNRVGECLSQLSGLKPPALHGLPIVMERTTRLSVARVRRRLEGQLRSADEGVAGEIHV